MEHFHSTGDIRAYLKFASGELRCSRLRGDGDVAHLAPARALSSWHTKREHQVGSREGCADLVASRPPRERERSAVAPARTASGWIANCNRVRGCRRSQAVREPPRMQAMTRRRPRTTEGAGEAFKPSRESFDEFHDCCSEFVKHTLRHVLSQSSKALSRLSATTPLPVGLRWFPLSSSLCSRCEGATAAWTYAGQARNDGVELAPTLLYHIHKILSEFREENDCQ